MFMKKKKIKLQFESAGLLIHQILVSSANSSRYPVKPHLVHGDKPHDSETQAHQSTCDQYDPCESAIKLGEIPGTDIGGNT